MWSFRLVASKLPNFVKYSIYNENQDFYDHLTDEHDRSSVIFCILSELYCSKRLQNVIIS